MKEIVKSVEKKLKELNKYDSEVMKIIEDSFESCVSFYSQRDGIILLNSENEIISIDDRFKDWFKIDIEKFINKKFCTLFDESISVFVEEFLKEVEDKRFLEKNSMFIKIGRVKKHLDLKIEILEINKKVYKLVIFKDKEFDYINYQLSFIEKKVDNIIVRIKDFKILMQELVNIFVESNLFDAAWVGKIDREFKKVIPIVTTMEYKEFDFDEISHVVEVLFKKNEIIFENEKGYKTEIIFPLFKRWDYKNSDEIVYVVLVFSKEKIIFKDSETYRLREIIYKINVAISDLMLKQEAQNLILKDPLTNTYLRKVLIEKMKEYIDDKIPFAFVLIDIDKLSRVNDVLGFWAGDEVLKKLANYLNDLNAFISRYGSDEFGLIIKGDKEKVYKELDKLIKFNDNLLKINGSTLFMPISISVGFFPEDASKLEELILKTEKALKEAKKKGGNKIEYVSENLNLLPKDYLEIQKELKEAIINDEYVMYYQPIIDIKNKKVWGVEALLRWKSKKRGLVSPAKFIPILEESGLINEVGDIVIDKVIDSLKEFEEYNLHIAFSLNLSVTQLLSKNIAREIIKKCDKKKINKEKLVVEITESVLMENLEILNVQLEEFKKNNIKVEIDDFGTGYSSLAYLKRIPVYALKIDREFVKDILVDEEDLSIVDAIISIAKSLKKETIAEGVEEKEQFLKLNDMGVDKIQGYYFAKPMTKEELIKYLEEFDFNKFL